MAKYLKAKTYILQLIQHLAPNSKLPSERELMEALQYSRPTIQKALAELENDGFIYRVARQGSFSADKRLRKSLTKLEGFTEELLRNGDTAHTRLLSFEIIPADEIIAAKLDISVGENVYYIVRLRCKNGDPIILDYSYFAAFALEGISADLLTQSIYQYIEQQKKLKISMSKQIVSASLPDEFTCLHLNLKANEPIISIENTSYLADRRPFEHTLSCKNPQKYLLEIVSYK